MSYLKGLSVSLPGETERNHGRYHSVFYGVTWWDTSVEVDEWTTEVKYGRETDQKSQYVLLMIIQNSEYSAEVWFDFLASL